MWSPLTEEEEEKGFCSELSLNEAEERVVEE